MAMCPSCGKDYLEYFESGSKCFGCGKWERGVQGTSKRRSNKPQVFDLIYLALTEQDYQKIWDLWKIPKELVDLYGWYKGYSKENNNISWLVFPVVNKYGVAQYLQYRHWEGYHKNRFYTTATQKGVPEGTLWHSWYRYYDGDDPNMHSSWFDGKGFYTHVAVVESISDAVKVSQVCPSISMLGSALDPAKVDRLKELDTTYLIMLDSDMLKHSLELQKMLGINKAKVLMYPAKDPASLTITELYDIIHSAVGGKANVT